MTTFSIQPHSGALRVVGSDGVVYGGVNATDNGNATALKLLEIVGDAFAAGTTMPAGEVETLSIMRANTPDGSSAWQITDAKGTIHAAVNMGLWPFPGARAAEKMKEIVAHAISRGREYGSRPPALQS